MTTSKVLIALSTFAEYGSEPLDLLKASGLKYALNPSGRRLMRVRSYSLGRIVEKGSSPALNRIQARCSHSFRG